MITLTLRTKRVFRAVVRGGLPAGKALRLVLSERTQNDGPRIGIKVGEPKGTDQPVLHEGVPVTWVSAGVLEAHDGCTLDLEIEGFKGLGIGPGLPRAEHEIRSYGHARRETWHH